MYMQVWRTEMQWECYYGVLLPASFPAMSGQCPAAWKCSRTIFALSWTGQTVSMKSQGSPHTGMINLLWHSNWSQSKQRRAVETLRTTEEKEENACMVSGAEELRLCLYDPVCICMWYDDVLWCIMMYYDVLWCIMWYMVLYGHTFALLIPVVPIFSNMSRTELLPGSWPAARRCSRIRFPGFAHPNSIKSCVSTHPDQIVLECSGDVPHIFDTSLIFFDYFWSFLG